MSLIDRRTLILSGAATALTTPALASASSYSVPDRLAPRIVDIKSQFLPGEVHVDPGQYALYWTLPGGQAIRYPVGIGTDQRYTAGTFTVKRKAEWPRWTPTKAMIRREPEIYEQYAAGMDGGGENPLGARALYLYRNGRDTYLRIHGTPKPRTVEARVSNGCVRMINEHVIDLYSRVPTGTRVVFH